MIRAPLQKLFTFVVKEEVLDEMARVQDKIRRTYVDRRFRSLDILEKIC